MHISETIISKPTRDLVKAVYNNQPIAVRRAIYKGGNVNVKLAHGNRLLHVTPTALIGAILLNHGANIDAQNNLQQTPLHTSMRRNVLQLTMLLIDRGANANSQEADGNAPLHLAEADEVNNALLAKGANVNIQNNVGDTPLLVAIRTKGSPVVDILTGAGADKYIRNNQGHDALIEFKLLVQRRHKEILKVAKALVQDPIQAVAQTPKTLFAFDLSKKTDADSHTVDVSVTAARPRLAK